MDQSDSTKFNAFINDKHKHNNQPYWMKSEENLGFGSVYNILSEEYENNVTINLMVMIML